MRHPEDSIRSFLLIIFLSVSACSHTPSFNTDKRYGDPFIKVAILRGVKSVEIAGEDVTAITSGRRQRLNAERGITITGVHEGYKAGKSILKSDSIEIIGNDLNVNGRSYRGSVSVIKEEGGLTVINSIGIESYLMGLINHEISSSWHVEAVKAQAVAARTYALEKLRSREGMHYHMESTVIDQVYGGSRSEDYGARRAVLETKGEVVFYNGDIAHALYHSSCGGRTESSGNVWGKDYPYLRSIQDSYCIEAPNYFWTYETTSNDIKNRLEAAGYRVRESALPVVMERNSNDRVKRIDIGGEEISGKVFREIMGYDIIKSTRFHIDDDDGSLVFTGSGSGHGVGMCQWGAKGMAEAGFDYQDILRNYYPGVSIRRAY